MHPLTSAKVPKNSAAVHWFEQSSYAIKDSSGTIVQVDPFFPHDRPAEKFIHAKPPHDESTLPTDYILLTHDHSDHTCTESIERIWQVSPNLRIIGPEESIEHVLDETTVPPDRTITVFAGDKIEIENLVVWVVYAKPEDGDPAADIQPPDVTHLGYVVRTSGPRLYFSGDPINTFAEHEELLQAVAKRKPTIGFLTTHPSEGEFPFFNGSVKTAQAIGLKHAVPAHRACFVKRDYDPSEWAANFSSEDGPQPLIIERNSHVVYKK